MNSFLVFAAHNTVFALVLAIFVYGLTRVLRNPPLAHLLWLLVLIKLVAPPVMHVDWLADLLPESTQGRNAIIAELQIPDASRIDSQKVNSHLAFIGETAQGTQASATSAKEHDDATGIATIWIRVRPFVFWIWIGGAVVCALVAVTRIIRFELLLRDTLPAPERLQRITRRIADKIGIRRVPDVRYVQCAEVPLLWCAGRRPTIVLPMRLLRQLDDKQIAMILAHELAHLRRRDHWVRAVEMIVSAIYWWNPMVWVIRRQLHHAEDLCCDAWVRWSIPNCTKSYAEVVFKTAESLTPAQVSAPLLPASPLLRSLSLQARIEMILESRFAPQVSTRSKFITILLALFVLPLFVQTTKALADTKDEAPDTAEVTSAPTASAFPYQVEFEQGVTDFKEGDSITILDVRGTDKTFIPGNIYWIKGRYTLASHDSAMLAAYTTATNAADGTGRSWKVQTMNVDKGKGTFTLFLPMSCEGWPHVSFYAEGPSIGGNYFGTGDSVLKKWWGSK